MLSSFSGRELKLRLLRRDDAIEKTRGREKKNEIVKGGEMDREIERERKREAVRGKKRERKKVEYEKGVRNS